MLGANGLKVAAKRTAFGDVSNTAKNLLNPNDDPITIGKNNGTEVLQKPLAPPEKSAAFLRPAQRPLAGVKGFLTNSSTTQPSGTTAASIKPLAVDAQQASTKSRTLSRRATTIYKDPVLTESDEAQPVAPAILQNNAPIAPVHQNLGPRQHKSQPQLKRDEPLLRRTQSKHVGTAAGVSCGEQISVASNYQGVTEEQPGPVEEHNQESVGDEGQEVQQAEEVSIQMHEDIEREDKQLPPLPLVSEPEEYWEEEEEEEVYDEQGYTTAHSYRSRGDNTTGGATIVLFPKVTNKVKKELAIAKDIVENSRTPEEIEDEAWDTSMVAEYGDEIFSYMRELEVSRLHTIAKVYYDEWPRKGLASSLFTSTSLQCLLYPTLNLLIISVTD